MQKNTTKPLLQFTMLLFLVAGAGCTTSSTRDPASQSYIADSQNPYVHGYLVGHPYLFHSGQRKDLMGDVQAHTVPQAAWDQYIMGSKTNFDLPAYRRGLYGAETIAGTGLYSTYNVLAGHEPWVVMIKLNDSCLAPANVWSGEYLLPANKPVLWTAFTDWYSRNKSRYAKIASTCLQGEGDDRGWEEGVPYDLAKASPEDIKLTRTCGPALNDFLTDKKIKLVSDVENDDSWYIRDRSCIDDIVGTPDELYELLAGNQNSSQDNGFVGNFFGGGDPSNSPVGNLMILTDVISETSHLQTNQIPQLKSLEAALTDKTYAKHIRPGNELRLDNHDDIEEIALRLIRATRGAIEHGAVAPFQQSLQSWLKATFVAMRKQCLGQQGVSADHADACADASQAASVELMKILYANIDSVLLH